MNCFLGGKQSYLRDFSTSFNREVRQFFPFFLTPFPLFSSYFPPRFFPFFPFLIVIIEVDSFTSKGELALLSIFQIQFLAIFKSIWSMFSVKKIVFVIYPFIYLFIYLFVYLFYNSIIFFIQVRILTEPKNALIPQYQMLFGMDKVNIGGATREGGGLRGEGRQGSTRGVRAQLEGEA